MRIAYFTICSANYLAYARTLYASLSAADPRAGEHFHLFLADEALPETVSASLGFPAIEARELDLPHIWDMAMRYSIMEFNTAIKPDCFLHLFDTLGYDAAVYLDPDILVVKQLTHVEEALEAGADLVLTPHACAPLEDGFDPDDRRLLQTGSYNLGFAGFANSASSRAFLGWWSRRLAADCRVDLQNGLFVDQKFMDLAPCYVDRTAILRHKGYNAAYWNLSERPVTEQGGHLLAGGEPLHFFHFSGVVPQDRSVFSKHQNRFERKDIGAPLCGLLDSYLDRLAAFGHAELKALPYAYGAYTDGTPIPDIVRKAFARSHAAGVRERASVFAPRFDYLDRPAPGAPKDAANPITVLMHEIWLAREDLQAAFPLTQKAGRREFTQWFLATAQREYGLQPAMMRQTQAAYDLGAAERAGEGQPWLRKMRSAAGHAAHMALSRAHHLRSYYRRLPISWRMRVRSVLFAVSRMAEPGSKTPAAPALHLRGAPQQGVGLYGYFLAPTGVGEGARRALHAAEIAGADPHPVLLRSAADLSSDTPEGYLVAAPGSFETEICHVNADQMAALPEWRRRAKGDGLYRIGYWAWELEQFPSAFDPAFDRVDEIWTPSRFVQAAVAARTDKPVLVVPHPICAAPPDPVSRAAFGLPEDRFLFLCAFDFASFMTRKNPEGVYKAFRRAFPKPSRDGPALVIKAQGRPPAGEERGYLTRLLRGEPDVFVIDQTMTSQRYRALQNACDAFVSLHRAEGFGLNIAECMGLGKPVIATHYGGVTDFFGPETGLAVGYDERPLEPGEYLHGEGAVWAEPRLEEAAEHMARLAQDREAFAQLAQAGCAAVNASLTPAIIGAQIAARLGAAPAARHTIQPQAPASHVSHAATAKQPLDRPSA